MSLTWYSSWIWMDLSRDASCKISESWHSILTDIFIFLIQWLSQLVTQSVTRSRYKAVYLVRGKAKKNLGKNSNMRKYGCKTYFWKLSNFQPNSSKTFISSGHNKFLSFFILFNSNTTVRSYGREPYKKSLLKTCNLRVNAFSSISQGNSSFQIPISHLGHKSVTPK